MRTNQENIISQFSQVRELQHQMLAPHAPKVNDGMDVSAFSA